MIKNFAYDVDKYSNGNFKLEKLISESQSFVKMKRYDDLVVRFLI